MKSWKLPIITFFGLLGAGIVLDLAFNSFIQLIVIYVMINMLMSMSLNLVNGYTGQFSLGHAGFMAIGAYVSAYSSTIIGEINGVKQLFIFPILALLGGTTAGILGWIVGLPSLRLKGDYLAIVTLGLSEIIRVIILNTPAIGGARGMYAIAGPQDWDLGPFVVSKFMIGYFQGLLWIIICFLVIWRLIRSAKGRQFLAVREDEIAAESMGVDTTQAKVLSFAISSFFAGIAGSIFAHYANYINPSSFGFMRSVDSIIMVVLGGMGSLSGSLIAAIFITVVPEILRPLQEYTAGIDLRMVLYSLSLILFMILKPSGIFGKHEVFDLIKNYLSKKRKS